MTDYHVGQILTRDELPGLMDAYGRITSHDAYVKAKKPDKAEMERYGALLLKIEGDRFIVTTIFGAPQ